MAYYSGTANSITDLRTALRNSAQSDGWTLSGNVLSRSGVHVENTTSGNNLAIRGGLDSAMSTPSPYMHIGALGTGAQTLAITYPCTWRYFGFTDESWFVVHYDVTRYQMMAFGKSAVPGLPGIGTWVWASGEGQTPTIVDSPPLRFALTSNVLRVSNTPVMPWSFGSAGYLHHAIDGAGWSMTVNTIECYHGWLCRDGGSGTNLLNMQPSAWNAEIALLPLRALIYRGSNRWSLVLDHARARIARLDNLKPADILTIGSTKWMVFPWHARNVTARNGEVDSWGNLRNSDHTGTIGVAIQYEGP